MRLEIEIPSEYIQNAIQHARIRHWGFWEKTRATSKNYLVITEHNGVTNGEMEGHVDHEFDLGSLRDALSLMLTFKTGTHRYPYVSCFARIMTNNATPDDGDLLLQLAIFKEEKYA